MTIKDIERLTGITKANIRFYEAEGLITPDRKENGYRTYDASHVETLKRIRLFRALDIPIETIKDLAQGKIDLPQALESRKEYFRQQHNQLAMNENVIDRILESGEAYESVDVDVYITMLENEGAYTAKQDVNPKLNLPWRRFWARTFDVSLYNLILFLLMPSLFETSSMTLLRFVLDILLCASVEIILLAILGTTPGKAIFGITVTDLSGKRLTFRASFDRTVLVFQHGIGFNIPILSQYLEWNCLKSVEAGRELPWEEESEVNIRDSANWRFVPLMLLMIPIIAYPIVLQVGKMPTNIEHEQGYAGINPLLHDYRVEDVIYSNNENEKLPILQFQNDQMYFCYNGMTPMGKNPEGVELIGQFQYTPPESDPTAGVWELYIGSAAKKMYQLRVETDGHVILDYYENLAMQWSWLLSRVDTLDVRFQNEYTTFILSPEWYEIGAFNGDIASLNTRRIHQTSTMALLFREAKPEQITIIEEIHQGDDVLIRELHAVADEYGIMTIEITPVEADEQCYSLFRIPYETGEYIVCITYEKNN